MYEAMIERGQPLPPEARTPEPGTDRDIEEWFFRAFHDLSTCRDYSFGVGPIPWIAIDRYSERAGLDDVNHDCFVYLMREMDSAYLRWEAAEEKRRNPPKT